MLVEDNGLILASEPFPKLKYGSLSQIIDVSPTHDTVT